MQFIDRLTELWDRVGVARNTGASPEAIAAFELEHRIKMPDDVRLFYSHFNGTCDTDTAFMAFWPLDEIDTVPNKLSGYGGIPDYGRITDRLPNADNYFVFADHSIWVHVYAIQLRGEGSNAAPILWIADGITFDIIASSFSEYWMMYLDDPDSVIAPC